MAYTKMDHYSPSSTKENTINRSPDYGNRGEQKSPDDFVWENLDLDWMSRPDEDLFMVLPTAAQTEYQTSVYHQSVTLYVRMKSNDTTPGLLESALEVGPWKVPKDKLPVLVGSLAGLCLLFLMGVSLALYVCLHRRHPQKEFSVKSEASSVTSGQSERSAQSLSRDSLVLVTGPSSTHQARLLSDPTAANNFFFDYSFDFYFDPPEGGKETKLKEGFHVHTFGGRKHNASESLLQRGFSLRVAKLQKDDSTLGQRSESGPIIIKADGKASDEEGVSSEKKGEIEDGKIMRQTKENENSEECKSEIIDIENDFHQRSSFESQNEDSPSNQELHNECCYGYDRNALLDESLRTRSLPAWVRSKRRHHFCHNDFSYSLYGKKDESHLNKRRRNRMGSDAAQAIAICRSKVRLITPGSSHSSVRVTKESPSKSEEANLDSDEPLNVFNSTQTGRDSRMLEPCVAPLPQECQSPVSTSPRNGDSETVHFCPVERDLEAMEDDLKFSESITSIGSGDVEYQNLINDAVIIYNERTSL